MERGPFGEVPGARVTGPASRFDARGVRRGLPYAYDPRYDEPGDDADAAGEPPAWTTGDGDLLALPLPVWLRWGGWGWWRPQRLDRLGTLVSGARRMGTLRHRASGERLPVFGSRLGQRSYRIVARPRGGMRHEILAVHPEPRAEMEEEAEVFPLGAVAAGGGDAYGGATRDGYRLRLPHARLHTVLARLRREQLQALLGGVLPPDPGPVLARRLSRLARRARRVGTFRSRRTGLRLPVFAAPGIRILARPCGPGEAEILTVRAVEGELEVTGNLPVQGAPPRAEIQWTHSVPFTAPPSDIPKVKNALYILFRDDKPIYAGMAGSTDARTRMGEYRRNAHIYSIPPSTLRAHIGVVRNAQGLTTLQVESLLIRLLIRLFGQPQIRNSNSQINPYPVGAQEIVVEHGGPALPGFLHRDAELVSKSGQRVGRITSRGGKVETRFYAGVQFEFAEPLGREAW